MYITYSFAKIPDFKQLQDFFLKYLLKWISSLPLQPLKRYRSSVGRATD